MTDGADREHHRRPEGVRHAPLLHRKALQAPHPIYSETASYGHMGRESKVVTKTFDNAGRQVNGEGEALPLGGTERLGVVKKAFKLRGWLRVVSCSSSVVGRRCPWG
jgi:hypothetical protein